MATSTAHPRRAGSVPAVERAAAILVVLGNGQGTATLTELARHLRIHKSTAHNILETLAGRGFVSRDAATRRYRLGPTVSALGRAAGAGGADLATLARPHLIRLQRLSGETVILHGHDGAGSVILASEESPHELKVSARPGRRLPPTAGAVGKVLLAFAADWPPRLPETLPSFTPRTIVRDGRYVSELHRVRRAGVAYDEMEYLPGVRAVSVPVLNGSRANAEVVAALSIVGVAARVSRADLRRLAGPLRSAAGVLTAALEAEAELAPVPARALRPSGRRRRLA